MNTLRVGHTLCHCRQSDHEPRLVALTGGPGAGKTAVLELASRLFCPHVAVLPEAAGILFGGGFPRHSSEPGRKGAQCAIFQVQRQVERIVVEERRVAIGLCDRGTPDGLAYWPGSSESFWDEMDTSEASELGRYAAVIHLRTPAAEQGYDGSDPLRIEQPAEAREIDERIAAAWANHPRRFSIEPHDDFLTKARRALETVRGELPSCCLGHPIELGVGSTMVGGR